MRKTAAICLVITLLAWGTQRFALAQNQHQPADGAAEKNAASAETKTEMMAPSKADSPKPLQAYRLDFALHELAEGKKTNTRSYSMDLTTGFGDEIKIGTRVPVPVGPNSTQFQYMDVGTNIWAILRENGQLQVKSEISDIDMNPRQEHGTELAPIVRQMKIAGSTLLVTGKPIVIGTLDDPNSKRQFQLEVTATQLR